MKKLLTEWRKYVEEAKGKRQRVPSPLNLERAKNKVVGILKGYSDDPDPETIMDSLALMKKGADPEYRLFRWKNAYKGILSVFEKEIEDLIVGRTVVVRKYLERDSEKGMVELEELAGRKGKIVEVTVTGRSDRPLYIVEWLGDDEIARNLNSSEKFRAVKAGAWRDSNLMSSLSLGVEDPITIDDVVEIFGNIKKV